MSNDEEEGYLRDALADLKLAKRGTADDGEPIPREQRLELVVSSFGSAARAYGEVMKTVLNDE